MPDVQESSFLEEIMARPSLKRTSTTKRLKRNTFQDDSVLYKKWCRHLSHGPVEVKVRGTEFRYSPREILSGHLMKNNSHVNKNRRFKFAATRKGLSYVINKITRVLFKR